jgi:hypothetical protein
MDTLHIVSFLPVFMKDAKRTCFFTRLFFNPPPDTPFLEMPPNARGFTLWGFGSKMDLPTPDKK